MFRLKILTLTLLFLGIAHHAQAATYCVDTTGDTLPPAAANCSDTCTPGGGDCTLRDAIEAANADFTTEDTITFGVTGTITLTGSNNEDVNQTGDLDIEGDVIIQGPGINQLAIDGGGVDRVFDLDPAGADNFTVQISGLTVQGGVIQNVLPTFTQGGGGIRNNDLLTLQSVLITGNTVSGDPNSAANGGGILSFDQMSLDNSTVSENSSIGVGGGIANLGTNSLITNSTLSDNTGGGGLANQAGSITLVNATISGNENVGSGGGLAITSGTVTLANATVTNNTGAPIVGPIGGGGVYITGGPGLTLRNSILAGNLDTNGDPSDCNAGVAVTSGGYNLVGAGDSCPGVANGVNNDQVGTVASPINPVLSALGNNGGTTQTHALLNDSPAIDAANPTGCLDQNAAVLTQDQRGSLRPVAGLSNDGTPICDIGATEFAADLSISKSDNPDPVFEGNTFSYTIVVTNAGPDTASNIVITDTLPSEVIVGPVTSVLSCQVDGFTVTCTAASLASGGAIALTILVDSPELMTTLANTATVTSTGGDFDLSNNTTTIQTGVIPEEDNGGCSLGSVQRSLPWPWLGIPLGLFLIWMRRRAHA